MSRTYTESELIAMGLTQEQIDSVAAESQEEQVESKQNVNSASIADFSKHVEEALNRPLNVTSISALKRQSLGEVVSLPGFIDGEDFVVRMRRPSLLSLVRKGKIPNTLLNEATELFNNGTSTVGVNGNTLEDMMDVIDIICDASLLEPTYKEIQDNGIELTDEQLMAIFAYSQRGVNGLRQFRKH